MDLVYHCMIIVSSPKRYVVKFRKAKALILPLYQQVTECYYDSLNIFVVNELILSFSIYIFLTLEHFVIYDPL
jgi:hypothetical protein